MHRVMLGEKGEVLVSNLEMFVTDLVAAGRRWRTSVPYDPVDQDDGRAAMKVHTNGLPPSINGRVPVPA